MNAVAPRVLMTTPLPVPYQVELFDALAASGRIEVTILYQWLHRPDRSWDVPELRHRYVVLADMSAGDARNLLNNFDLVVFSGYQMPELRRLVTARALSGRPWCFWGERPGIHLPQWLGRYRRALMLPELCRRDIPIWGMGSWAVVAYREEFGGSRLLPNIPYFSRLSDFLAIDRRPVEEPPRRILFSGSLIKRKGVDLLMRAFLVIADAHPTLELHLIGDGPLREPLRRMAAHHADRVHFHGFRQWNELPTFYSNADILCAPSRYDGWGLIVPEGLAAGLLVISTDRTGAALDLIRPDIGWIVKANRLAPLVAALRDAMSTTSANRTERISRGREVAVAQDTSAGVRRVVKAIADTLAAFKSRVAGDSLAENASTP